MRVGNFAAPGLVVSNESMAPKRKAGEKQLEARAEHLCASDAQERLQQAFSLIMRKRSAEEASAEPAPHEVRRAGCDRNGE